VTGAAPPSSERRFVTALFADIVGFSTLAAQLEPEDLAALVDPVITGLTEILDRYGARVEKFAGDAVLGLFGVPYAHEDDADRAVLAALDMIAATPWLSPHRRGEEVRLRIGLGTGEVIARQIGSATSFQYGVLGDCVVLAQRLQSAADVGAVFADQRTADAIGSRYELRSLGPLQLKGRAEPVAAVQVLGRRTTNLSRTLSTSPLVGRDEALEATLDAVQRAAAGTPQTVVITGEPGVGKSRLVAEVLARLPAGARTLQTSCPSYGRVLPYLAWSRLLQAADDAPLNEPEVAALLGDAPAVHRGGSREPRVVRRAAHQALVQWVRGLAATHPLVTVVLDDVHWMDPASLTVVEDLIHAARPGDRVLVVLARRDSGSELPAAVASTATAIDVVPLAADQVVSIAEAMLGGRLDRAVSALVVDRAAGNPLLAEETVRSLALSGAVHQRGHAWRLRPGMSADAVPASLRGLLAAQLDELTQDERDALEVAALAGRRTSTVLVAHALGWPTARVRSVLAHVASSGLLDREDEDAVEFRHALIRDAIVERVPMARRQQRYLRLADAVATYLPADDRGVALVAEYLHRADTPRLALPHLLDAARRARRVGAHVTQRDALQRAVDAASRPPPHPARLDVLRDLAEVLDVLGHYQAAADTWRQTRELDPSADAWAGEAAAVAAVDGPEAGLAVVEAGLRAVSIDPSLDPRPLWHRKATLLQTLNDVAGAASAAEAGLALGAPDDSWAGRLMLARGAAASWDRRPDEARSWVARAVTVLERARDQRSLLQAWPLLGEVEVVAGNLDAATDALRRGIKAAEQAGDTETLATCLGNLAYVAIASGDWDEASDAAAAAAEEFERLGSRPSQAAAWANWAYALVMLDDLDGAHELARRSVELAKEVGATLVAADATIDLGLIAERRGDMTAAADLAQQALADLGESGAERELAVAAQALLRRVQAGRAEGDAAGDPTEPVTTREPDGGSTV
jgi:class 3 adenylate cyclase/tetratricopeptide (TPR) repeat protein